MPEVIQEWVTRQADRRPEGTAVAGADRTLTYGEIEALSNRLARSLRERGCAQGDRIALLMPKSATAIACIVGIYKAGCVYVPLDPASPVGRLQRIVRACGSRWVLAAGPVGDALEALTTGGEAVPGLAVGWLGRAPAEGRRFTPSLTSAEIETHPSGWLACATRSHDPAHILFTSGSTGAPKGVVITHANVIHFVEWAKGYFGLGPDDRLSGHSPLHFDLSVFDIFGAFAAGATLCLVPPELNVLAHRLADFIRSERLTQWFSVPSVLNYLARFDAIRDGDFPALRRVLWCGETLPTPTLIHWMRRLPHPVFTNLYGPTETTIASSYYTLPGCPGDERAPIPIGSACGGEELLVLDPDLRPVPRGEAGEIYIAGAGVSPGYWNDPDATRAAFRPDPRKGEGEERIYRTGDMGRVGDEGLVYFLGRVDSQIKSRGYRIEIGEVESALSCLGFLSESAVVAIKSEGFEGALLCCGYVARPGAIPTPVDLRRELGRALPGYMLPARWRAFERLPVNANGKIDRRALKEVFEQHESQTARHA